MDKIPEDINPLVDMNLMAGDEIGGVSPGAAGLVAAATLCAMVVLYQIITWSMSAAR